MFSGWSSVSQKKHMSSVNEPSDLYESTDTGSQSDLSSKTARPTLKEFPVGSWSFAVQENIHTDIEEENLATPRITIEFYGLNLFLQSRSKYVLKAASGILPESKLTAIMGPSGAGTKNRFFFVHNTKGCDERANTLFVEKRTYSFSAAPKPVPFARSPAMSLLLIVDSVLCVL